MTKRHIIFALLLATSLLPSVARADWLVVDGGQHDESMRDVTLGTLDAEGIPYEIIYAQDIDERLLSRFEVVWVPPETIWDANLVALMNGGAIDAWIRQGGIFAVMGAHNDASEPTGPAGSQFLVHLLTVDTDEAPTIEDPDHEIFTGALSGIPLTERDFFEWGSTCHGTVEPPPDFADAGGANLGTNPIGGSINTIMWSPANDRPAMIEYTLESGYVLMNMMTVDWVSPDNVVQAIVLYVHGIEANFPAGGAPPTASAGGPYRVAEGGTIPLDGSGADPTGAPVTFEWDLDGDGTYEVAGEDPVFDAAAFDGPTTATVAVRVTTVLGQSARAEVEITIDNGAPLAPAPVSPADGAVLPGPGVTLVVNAAADVPAESLVYRFELHRTQAMDDLVTFVPVETDAGQFGQDVQAEVTPPEPGTYYWRARADDDDGGSGAWSAPRSFTVGEIGGDGDADSDSDADADADADSDSDGDADSDADADADGDGDGDTSDKDDGCSCSTPGKARHVDGTTLGLLGLGFALIALRRRFPL